MPDPWDVYADKAMPAPVKRKLDRADMREAKKEAEKKDSAERRALSKIYRAYRKRYRIETIAAAPDPERYKSVLRAIKRVPPAEIEALIENDWVTELALANRYLLLHEISYRIIRERENAGLPPFDDGIPYHEPPKLFQRCRKILIGV